MGRVALHEKSYLKAAGLFQRAIKVAEDIYEQSEGVASIFFALGKTYFLGRNHRRALELYQKSQEMLTSLGINGTSLEIVNKAIGRDRARLLAQETVIALDKNNYPKAKKAAIHALKYVGALSNTPVCSGEELAAMYAVAGHAVCRNKQFYNGKGLFPGSQKDYRSASIENPIPRRPS